MTHTLAELKVLCQNPDLEPYWKEVLTAGLFLLMVMKNAVGDAADLGKRELDTERKLARMTKEGIAQMRATYEEKCAALMAQLDERNISHPGTINVLGLLGLCADYPIPGNE